MQLIVIATGVSSFVKERSGDTVVSYILWVILKTYSNKGEFLSF